MVESRMAEEDEFGRPLRFTPQWPPAPVTKQSVRNTPGCSMVFRKSSWPPPKDDVNVEQEASAVSNGQTPDSSSGSTNETNTSEAVISNPVKPKAVRGDNLLTSFFGKNQKPLIIPVRPKALQPESIALPEVFTGNPDAEAEASE